MGVGGREPIRSSLPGLLEEIRIEMDNEITSHENQKLKLS
jgi:hypothetical protein